MRLPSAGLIRIGGRGLVFSRIPGWVVRRTAAASSNCASDSASSAGWRRTSWLQPRPYAGGARRLRSRITHADAPSIECCDVARASFRRCLAIT